MLKDRVLFIDGEAIVIDKPAGLPVDRPRDRSPSVEDMLGELTFGFGRLPQPVHRLDRDTSGCLLLARNPKAHKRFGQAFEAGAVTKRYVAILDGEPGEDAGTIDLPLIKISSAEEGWRMTGAPSGKPALSRWRVLERVRGRAMVAFFPETGRTHQLRVHAAEGLGIPIVGDPVYGAGGPAVMLHAAGILVPRDGKPDVSAEAVLPVRFHNLGSAVAEIPEEAIVEEKFLAASGPGGQNVNKVATAVQLRVDVFRLGLEPYAYRRLKVLAGSRMTAGGELVITARRFRTQEANRADARERLAELVAKAHVRQAKRVKTRVSKAAKARRVDAKKGRGAVKAGRGRVPLD